MIRYSMTYIFVKQIDAWEIFATSVNYRALRIRKRFPLCNNRNTKAIGFIMNSERCIVYFVMLVKHDVVFKVVSENCNKTKEAKKNMLYFIRILILRSPSRRFVLLYEVSV